MGKPNYLLESRLRRKGYKQVAGCDEAGRGPLAGPVVACALILKRRRFVKKIDDSKKLSFKQRLEAFAEIKKKAFIGLGIVDEKIIDQINIYQATIKAMEEAIRNLPEPPHTVILDGKIKINSKIPYQGVVRADEKCFSVACASIVAKVTRDRIMEFYDRLYPQYGFARHKGYPTKAHLRAIRKYGPSPIHRFSFKPLKGKNV